ncbi:MAG: DNA primase [Candidatus Competibacteraceae bacterium]
MAARISQDFLDQLLNRVDLVELIDTRVPLRKLGRDYGACCPFHSEKTPSFTVSPSKQFYYCFGCGARGDAFRFLMDYERLSFMEAVTELARSVGLELPRGVSGGEADSQEGLLAWVEQAATFFRQQLHDHPARQKALDYLRRRGLDDATIKTFGIGYAPPGWDGLLRALTARNATPVELLQAGLVTAHDDGRSYDRFRDRIMFPILDRRGRTIAFGGRALGDAEPKYLNSPETPFFHKGRELYGLYEARQRERRLQRLVVVEGYMDVVALVQHGIANVVATLGTAITTEQVERLFRVTPEVIFCFDGDRAGREAAWRALENSLPLLKADRQTGFLFLPEGEDPDSLIRKEGRERFEQRLAQIKPLSDYFFERLGADINLKSIDGRARLAERARPLLEKLPESDFRDLMRERLKKITHNPLTRLSPPRVSTMKPRQVSPLRSPVRLIIALLLNDLSLAHQAGDLQFLRGLKAPGLSLVVELIELLQNNPQIQNAAQVLIRYENTPVGSALQQLAGWRPEYSADQLVAEFLGALKHLRERYGIKRQLLNKLAQGEALSDEEKETLRQLTAPAKRNGPGLEAL